MTRNVTPGPVPAYRRRVAPRALREPSRPISAGAVSGQAAVELVAPRAAREPSRPISARAVSGQASVELVALLPLALMVGLAVFALIAAQAAGEQAGEAAEAAALALLQGDDARAAASAALPAGVRRRATVALDGRHVHVHVRPRLPLPIPGLAERLAGDAHADAGPATP